MGVGKGFDAADSWNVALLFLIYAVLSVGIEHGVHWIKHLVHGKKTLMLVIHKAEEELFLLGTVSFLLLVFEDIIINNSCVKSSIFDGDNWALCHVKKSGYRGLRLELQFHRIVLRPSQVAGRGGRRRRHLP